MLKDRLSLEKIAQPQKSYGILRNVFVIKGTKKDTTKTKVIIGIKRIGKSNL